jgi:hypothetical protein
VSRLSLLVFLFDALRPTEAAFRSLKYFHRAHHIYEPRDLHPRCASITLKEMRNIPGFRVLTLKIVRAKRYAIDQLTVINLVRNLLRYY